MNVVVGNYPERGGASASSAIKYGGVVRAGRPAPVILKTGTKSLNEVRLPASFTPSAVLPADTGALRRFLSVARLRFNLSRLIRLPGSRFSGLHRAFAVRQNFLREWANPRQVLSLSAHVLGLAAGVYGQHTDRSEMKCPTKALKDSTK
jgi:hypothetical protein